MPGMHKRKSKNEEEEKLLIGADSIYGTQWVFLEECIQIVQQK
jgi:hypothetical protein